MIRFRLGRTIGELLFQQLSVMNERAFDFLSLTF